MEQWGQAEVSLGGRRVGTVVQGTLGEFCCKGARRVVSLCHKSPSSAVPDAIGSPPKRQMILSSFTGS